MCAKVLYVVYRMAVAEHYITGIVGVLSSLVYRSCGYSQKCYNCLLQSEDPALNTMLNM